ncbi:MAG: ABC transporter permease [Pseudomonadota bacterium]
MRILEITLTIITFIAIWQLSIYALQAPAFILPSPLDVIIALKAHLSLIMYHGSITLIEILAGLLLGASLGGASAILFVYSNRLRKMVMPVIVFSQAIPVFALAPILTLWMGYGISSKIFMSVLMIFFPVLSSFLDGLLRVERDLIDLSHIMGASPKQQLLKLQIPYALPDLASGLRLGAVYAPIGAVVGEWVGASKGLGYLMLLSNGRGQIDLMFSALLILGIMAITLYLLMDQCAKTLERYSQGIKS